MNLALKIKIIEMFGTQRDFAATIGEHESLVSEVVRGRRRLSAELMEGWAEELDADAWDLFEEAYNERYLSGDF